MALKLSGGPSVVVSTAHLDDSNYTTWHKRTLRDLVVSAHDSIWDIKSMRYIAFGADARDEEVEKLRTLLDRPRLHLEAQQWEVLNQLVTNNRHMMVRARAGTGKTTTVNECMAWIVEMYRAMQRNCTNPSITIPAIPTYSALSYHQLGLEFMRDNGYERDIRRLIDLGKSNAGGIWPMMDALGIRSHTHDDEFTKLRIRKLRTNLRRLVGYCKNEWLSPTERNVMSLCDRYDVTLERGTLGIVCDHLADLLRLSLNVRTWGIQFDDQLWWQAEMRAELRNAPSLVFVDEYQDTNKVQAEMVRKLIEAGARVVVVGDERQSIFGFRGSSTHAMDEGETLLNTTQSSQSIIVPNAHWSDEPQLHPYTRGGTVLPLTRTRRCSQLVVQLVQAIVPDFECLPGAPMGELGIVQDTQLITWLKAGDVVLCRNNADLIALAYKLLAKSIPCVIKGRDIGDKLCELVDDVQQLCVSMTKPESTNGVSMLSYRPAINPSFGEALKDWYMAKRKPLLLEGDDAERRLQSLQDQYDCLNVLAMEGMDALTIKNTIRHVFGEGERDGKITLATGHKFKGLEVDTVDNRLVIIRPDRLGLEGRNDEDSMQELNVLNVMLTRAKGGLYFVPYVTKKGRVVEVPMVLEKRWKELTTVCPNPNINPNPNPIPTVPKL